MIHSHTTLSIDDISELVVKSNNVTDISVADTENQMNKKITYR